MQLPLKIEPFVPHDGDMSLLDEIIERRPTGITAQVFLHAESMFAEPQGVPAAVGIEYMGQAIAAYAGLQARERNQPVKIGFLVSTRRYKPGISHFPLNSTLQIFADVVTDGDTGLQTFECSIKAEGIACSANLNVFMPQDVEQFLKAEK